MAQSSGLRLRIGDAEGGNRVDVIAAMLNGAIDIARDRAANDGSGRKPIRAFGFAQLSRRMACNHDQKRVVNFIFRPGDPTGGTGRKRMPFEKQAIQLSQAVGGAGLDAVDQDNGNPLVGRLRPRRRAGKPSDLGGNPSLAAACREGFSVQRWFLPRAWANRRDVHFHAYDHGSLAFIRTLR